MHHYEFLIIHAFSQLSLKLYLLIKKSIKKKKWTEFSKNEKEKKDKIKSLNIGKKKNKKSNIQNNLVFFLLVLCFVSVLVFNTCRYLWFPVVCMDLIPLFHFAFVTPTLRWYPSSFTCYAFFFVPMALSSLSCGNRFHPSVENNKEKN